MMWPRFVVGLLAVGCATAALVAQTRAPEPAPVEGVRVSGVIVMAHPGRHAPPTEITLRNLDGLRPNYPTVPVGPGGSFVFDHVTPGEYQLSPNPNGIFSSTTITVRASDVRDVRITVVGHEYVKVNVTMDDGSAPPRDVQVRALVRDELGGGGGGLVAGMTRDLIIPLEEDCFLFPLPPAGYSVTALRSGNVDLLASPLRRSAGTTRAEPVVLELSRTKPDVRRPVTIAGRILGARAGTDVELANAAEGFGPFGAVVIARGTTNADGAFTFPNVPRGVYEIHVPPAVRVKTNLVAVGKDVRVEIGDGGAIYSVRPVPVSVPPGGDPARWPGEFWLVLEGDRSRARVIVDQLGFWGTVPPGSYRARIEGLRAPFSIRTFSAGSADLTKVPFVVPTNRPPEQIQIALQVSAGN